MEHTVDTATRREAAWERAECQALITELQGLRRAMSECEERLVPWLAQAAPARQASARNLAHYLAMRSVDARGLQDRLARLGLASLGRAESHVMAKLDKVLGLLHVLIGHVPIGRPGQPLAADEPAGLRRGRAQLDRQAERLFGRAPAERRVRVMVTLPSEAAHDAVLVGSLVHAGMDIARIDCAHDDAAAWAAMASHVRGASQGSGRTVKLLMDLAGPRIRTGPIAPGPQVLKLRPVRDAFGQVSAPALLGLRALGAGGSINGAAATIGVDAAWLAQLHPGDRIDCVDSRGSERRLTVLDERCGGVLVQCERTVYLSTQTRLRLQRRGAHPRESALGDLPETPGRIALLRGDLLRLTPDGLGQDASHGSTHQRVRPASIACTLPEVLAQLKKGERIWFDEGRIGGLVRRVAPRGVDIEITDIAEGGATLGADKGIKLPDSRLTLPALTAGDLADLDVVVRHADLVGLPFAQSAQDVHALRGALAARGAPQLGLILKVQTRHGFEHLPEMLFATMADAAAGVTIARGDLAVECGVERLAEVQEEILWACEAAHLPVVWATPVLESLAKTGLPSRAEITDAALGERAECVMLNKGPQLLGAMRTLDSVLRCLPGDPSKQRPLLRVLKAWGPAPN